MRPARRLAVAFLIVSLAVVAGCDNGAGRSDAALAAFRSLLDRPDLTYRMTVGAVSGPGGAQAGESEVVVVGRDSKTTTKSAGFEMEMIHKGDRQFSRMGGERWTEAERSSGGSSDVASLLVAVAGADLQAIGPVLVEGSELHRVVTRDPFAWPVAGSGGGSNGEGSPQLIAVDLLVDPEGRPVQATMQVMQGPGGPEETPGAGVTAILRFSDVGAPLSIETPVVP